MYILRCIYIFVAIRLLNCEKMKNKMKNNKLQEITGQLTDKY